MGNESHDLQLTILTKKEMSNENEFVMNVTASVTFKPLARTLNRLSCNTFLIAISSVSLGAPMSLAWKTTPKDPFPTTLQLVYEISRVSADLPSEAMTLTTFWGSSMAI